MDAHSLESADILGLQARPRLCSPKLARRALIAIIRSRRPRLPSLFTDTPSIDDMAILKITEFPAKVLTEVGEPVEDFDDGLKKLVTDMFETMYDAEGVGLAAPQVGLSLRLFVVDCDGIKLVAANPEIIEADGEQKGDEGCLSVGKVASPLKRASRVVLRAQDVDGNWFEKEAVDLAARCFLHETDHCDGILFIKRLTPLKRDMVKRRFQKMKKQD